MDKMKILIAGGDRRQLYCAEALAQKHNVYTAGFDDSPFPSPDQPVDCVILPVVPLNADGSIFAPGSTVSLYSGDIRKMLKSTATVISGSISSPLTACFSGLSVYEYISREDFCIKNAVLTAEGAISLAVSELPVSLNGLSVLIVGMGRIGCVLAGLLKAFGADITAAVHNPKSASKAAAMGIHSVSSTDTGTDYGLVFNTVPKLIFGRDKLYGFRKDTVFIDLASAPGGIDFSAAEELGIKAIWAKCLPAKYSPVTAGKIIAETAEIILSERRLP